MCSLKDYPAGVLTPPRLGAGGTYKLRPQRGLRSSAAIPCKPDSFALALDALDAQHIELVLDVAEGVVQAIYDHTSQQLGRVLHQPRLARTLPVEGCHPCPKALQGDQRPRWISL
jgi:hypothetical protein